jgi:Leucine-rich repeat (LRR) protein
LPELPKTLEGLWVKANHLTTLPELPPNLRFLDFSFNRIESLPSLPPYLRSLVCSCNLLTSLPEFPPTITDIEIYGNNISILPDLHDTDDTDEYPDLNKIYISSNTELFDYYDISYIQSFTYCPKPSIYDLDAPRSYLNFLDRQKINKRNADEAMRNLVMK